MANEGFICASGLIRGDHEMFNRSALDQSIHNLRDVRAGLLFVLLHNFHRYFPRLASLGRNGFTT
jgi:hypothetical protein